MHNPLGLPIKTIEFVDEFELFKRIELAKEIINKTCDENILICNELGLQFVPFEISGIKGLCIDMDKEKSAAKLEDFSKKRSTLKDEFIKAHEPDFDFLKF